jgi:hypothetical protein
MVLLHLLPEQQSYFYNLKKIGLLYSTRNCFICIHTMLLFRNYVYCLYCGPQVICFFFNCIQDQCFRVVSCKTKYRRNSTIDIIANAVKNIGSNINQMFTGTNLKGDSVSTIKSRSKFAFQTNEFLLL